MRTLGRCQLLTLFMQRMVLILNSLSIGSTVNFWEFHYIVSKGIVRKHLGGRYIIEMSSGGLTFRKNRLFSAEKEA